jgi:hypothetical protein
MPLETVTYIGDLVVTNPPGTDPKSQGDDHLRNIKTALANCFAGFTGAVCVAGADGGAVNAYTLTTATALPAYGSKMAAVFSPAITNTGAATLNISGLGVKTIKRVDGTDVVSGDLVAASLYCVLYDGTVFRLFMPTKNYIDQLAFSSALPAQAGNAGLFVTTNGSVASWASPLPPQTGNNGRFLQTNGATTKWANPGLSTFATSSGAVPVTLTSASAQYQTLTFTALGQHVTLPDATTLTAVAPQYILRNAGIYPFGIRDNSGQLLGAVSAGGVAYVSLENAASAAGIWSVEGTGIDPGLITIDNLLSTTYVAPLFAPFCALDSNTSIHFVAISSGFAAVVLDNLGKVISTPVTVSAAASMVPKMAFKLTGTTAIVFYTDGTNYNCVVLSLTGASPSLSLSVGTLQTTTTAYFSFEDGKTPFQNIVLLSPTLLVAVTANTLSTGPTVGLAISIAGTAITLGASTTIAATADGTTLGHIYLFALTSTTALVVYQNGNTVTGVVISISGTSISTATPVAAPAGYAASSSNHSMAALTATKFIGVSGGSGTPANAAVLTVTGTTVAWGALSSFGPSNTFNDVWGSNENATIFNMHVVVISSTLAYAWAIANNGTVGQSILVALTESGGNLTVGTALLGSFSQAGSNADGYGVGLSGAAGTNEMLALQQAGASTYHTVRAVPHKISAAGVVTMGGALGLAQDFGTVANINTLFAARLANNDYALGGGTLNQHIPIIRSNGDSATVRGRIPCPLANTTQNVPMVVGQRMIYMVLPTATTATAPGTKQVRILNVEVAI